MAGSSPCAPMTRSPSSAARRSTRRRSVAPPTPRPTGPSRCSTTCPAPPSRPTAMRSSGRDRFLALAADGLPRRRAARSAGRCRHVERELDSARRGGAGGRRRGAAALRRTARPRRRLRSLRARRPRRWQAGARRLGARPAVPRPAARPVRQTHDGDGDELGGGDRRASGIDARAGRTHRPRLRARRRHAGSGGRPARRPRRWRRSRRDHGRAAAGRRRTGERRCRRPRAVSASASSTASRRLPTPATRSCCATPRTRGRLVPIGEADRLWRYGADADAVTLDALDGSTWQKRRGAIDTAIAESAKALAALAAEREAQTTEPIVPPARRL